MLVIGREVGQIITIGDHIRIKVVSIDKGSVRMGICAPRHIVVNRAEVHQRIKDQAATKPSA